MYRCKILAQHERGHLDRAGINLILAQTNNYINLGNINMAQECLDKLNKIIEERLNTQNNRINYVRTTNQLKTEVERLTSRLEALRLKS